MNSQIQITMFSVPPYLSRNCERELPCRDHGDGVAVAEGVAHAARAVQAQVQAPLQRARQLPLLRRVRRGVRRALR